MGLDNIPHRYPCQTQGTAVRVQRKNQEGTLLTNEDGSPSMVTDCEATQACGGCPYKNAYDKSGLTGGSVIGMFGTDCWYRGKYGNHLLSLAGYEDYDFYGDNEDGTYKSPKGCLSVAELISETLADDTDTDGQLFVDGQDIAPDLRYAEWYLRWVAEECDGMDAWY